MELLVPANITKIISDLYEQNKAPLIAHLEATGIAAPMVVGIEWRLDYAIRSKHGGRGNVPMYFLTLKLKDRGIVRDEEIIATQEELQDMLAKVFFNLTT